MTPIDPPSQPGASAPNLSRGEREIILSWLEPSGENRLRLRASRFRGGQWTGPMTIVESDRLLANWADVPSVTEAPDGTLLAHFAEKSAGEQHAYDVQLAALARGGSVWRRIGAAHDDRTSTEHGFVSALSEGRDGFRLFWLDGRELDAHASEPGAMTLRTARVDSRGIRESRVLDRRVCDCCGTSAVLTNSGPVIAYRDRSEGEIRDISAIRSVDGEWSSPVRVHEDRWKIQGCPVNGPALARSGDLLVAAWFTSPAQPEVRLAFSRDSAASFGPFVRLNDASDGETLGRVGVVLRDHSAIASWLAADGEHGRVLVRRVGSDGQMGSSTTAFAMSPARASGFPKMISDGDDLVFAWTDVGPPSRIRVGRWPLAAVPSSGTSTRSRATPPPSLKAFRARTLDRRAASLANLEGRVVLLNLFATWCEPCRAEIPELRILHERYRPRGLEVISVSLDDPEASVALQRFVETHRITYPVWHDIEQRAVATFGAPALPASFVLDPSGAVVWKRFGAITSNDRELLATIDRMLETAAVRSLSDSSQRTTPP